MRNSLKNRLKAAPRKRSLGQSLVEFALFVPILLVILVIALDLGRLYLGWVTLNNISRIGANFASTNPTAWQGSGNAIIQAQYQTLMMNDAGNINCTLPNPLPQPDFLDSSYVVGARVAVSVPCTFQLITPMLDRLIGNGSGGVAVTGTTTFGIRVSYAGTDPIGGGGSSPGPSPTAAPTDTPTPTPTPTATPTPTPTSTASGSQPPTPTPTPTAAPTPTPPIVTFYGTPSGIDSYGGGPPATPTGPNENQIVGVPNTLVTFTNTTSGSHTSCVWQFGDTGTLASCANSVTHTYTTRGLYNVTLSIDGGTLTRSTYVLIGCKVPALIGSRKNSATGIWTNPNSSAGGGFAAGNITFLPGTGNYIIHTQSWVGGYVNPTGGCSGATITVGP